MKWLADNAMGLVGTVGGIIQGALDRRQQRQNINRTISAQKEAAQLEFQRNLEMWNKANVYNAPEAQMARLKSANLNPNLVYGSGSVAGNQSGALPKYNAPRPDYRGLQGFQVLPALQQYQQFRKNQSDIDLVNELRRVKTQEAQHARDYYYGRSQYGLSRSERERLREGKELGYEDIRRLDGTKIPIRSTPYSKLFDTQLQGRQKQIDNIQSQIDLRAKEIEWYLWNKPGSGIGRMIGLGMKSIRGPVRSIAKKKTIPGLKKLPDWKWTKKFY
mgnify:CR=1 FL=1